MKYRIPGFTSADSEVRIAR